MGFSTSKARPSSDCAARGARAPGGNGGTGGAAVGGAWRLESDDAWCKAVAALPWRLCVPAEPVRRVSDDAVSERARSSGEGDFVLDVELDTDEMLELAFTRTTGLGRVPTPTDEEGVDSGPSLRSTAGDEGLVGWTGESVVELGVRRMALLLTLAFGLVAGVEVEARRELVDTKDFAGEAGREVLREGGLEETGEDGVSFTAVTCAGLASLQG